MKYINPNSKSGLVNKFADFIVKHIDESHKSIIQVIYLGGFFIIKGITESDKVLNLQKIRDSFVEKYEYLLFPYGITNINFIDVIQYDYKFAESDYSFKFYNSDLIRYPQKVINFLLLNHLNVFEESIHYDDYLRKTSSSILDKNESDIITEINLVSISSEFPYGYSLKCGRLQMFYSEYIINHIINIVDSEKIIFNFSLRKNNEDDFDIKIISDSKVSHLRIESLILDVFDFNLTKFKNTYLNEIDLEYEIENQLIKPKWFIKDRLDDLIMI
jgi:hypothetical protein